MTLVIEFKEKISRINCSLVCGFFPKWTCKRGQREYHHLSIPLQTPYSYCLQIDEFRIEESLVLLFIVFTLSSLKYILLLLANICKSLYISSYPYIYQVIQSIPIAKSCCCKIECLLCCALRVFLSFAEAESNCHMDGCTLWHLMAVSPVISKLPYILSLLLVTLWLVGGHILKNTTRMWYKLIFIYVTVFAFRVIICGFDYEHHVVGFFLCWEIIRNNSEKHCIPHILLMEPMWTYYTEVNKIQASTHVMIYL